MKREYIHPNFDPQKTLKQEIGDALAERARMFGRTYEEYTKDFGTFAPGLVKDINSRRVGVAKHNTSEFFIYLQAHIFGGEVMSSKERLWGGFNPDISYEDDERIVHTEVKAISKKNGAPMVTCFQFRNYCEDFIRLAVNGQSNCGVDYAFYRYGGNKNEKLYNYDLNGLVKRLSESVNELHIVPLNVLIPLLAAHESKGFNHENSYTSRDIEYYWEPFGGNFTRISKNPETMEEFFKDFESRGISREVLCLEGLKREEFESSDNIFCRRYKVKPFRVIRYSNEDLSEWAQSFAENYYKIFEAMELDADSFDKIVKKHINPLGDVPF